MVTVRSGWGLTQQNININPGLSDAWKKQGKQKFSYSLCIIKSNTPLGLHKPLGQIKILSHPLSHDCNGYSSWLIFFSLRFMECILLMVRGVWFDGDHTEQTIKEPSLVYPCLCLCISDSLINTVISDSGSSLFQWILPAQASQKLGDHSLSNQAFHLLRENSDRALGRLLETIAATCFHPHSLMGLAGSAASEGGKPQFGGTV